MIAPGITVTPENEAEWLAGRRNSIGASESAAVIGVNPYCTPVEKWMEKTGRSTPAEANHRMRVGKLVEPVIARLYEEDTGRAVVRQQVFVNHVILPFISATIDGVCDDGRLVEFKAAGSYSRGWGSDSNDDIPESYLIQVNHQMLVSGARVADVAVLFGDLTFRVYEGIERNVSLCNAIEDVCSRFWAHVQDDTPPTWGKLTAADLAVLFPGCDGEVQLSDRTAADVAAYEAATEAAKASAALADGYKAAVLKSLGNAQVGRLPDGRAVKKYLEDVPARAVSYESKAFTKLYFKVLKGTR